MNQCNFIGHLTKDMEMRRFPSGALKVIGRIAVNGDKKREGKEVAFLQFQAWGSLAEYLYEKANLKKGSKIAISGHMVTDDSYEKDGKIIYPETYIKVDKFFHVDGFPKYEETDVKNEEIIFGEDTTFSAPF